MKTVYKVFLIIFAIIIAANLYFFDWQLGIMHTENTKFVFSIAAALIGMLLTVVMNTWSQLGAKR
ncbi:hypothetical protein SAMN05443429_10643 [Cruoricaptor ignavus]|uniref:DUF1049 domain-containing protein n=1 Tax=Cruoricaptor ignavus TaxID=1118202 RepID=A0A1M6EYX1_9FLAO|nr:hypothetical protein [Cruoricaptor ignavus]QOR73691.1 hypothetical protein IMZ16_09285 [Cruoricaptor ignavus]SHI90657.1 hypothetical protein SAMN05443429_10643 [Cruoricaptor ignavus]